jgi:hypothetical protein
MTPVTDAQNQYDQSALLHFKNDTIVADAKTSQPGVFAL